MGELPEISREFFPAKQIRQIGNMCTTHAGIINSFSVVIASPGEAIHSHADAPGRSGIGHVRALHHRQNLQDDVDFRKASSSF